jgi:hypothetical protein
LIEQDTHLTAKPLAKQWRSLLPALKSTPRLEKLLIDLKTGQLTGTASFRLRFFFVIGYNGKFVKYYTFILND